MCNINILVKHKNSILNHEGLNEVMGMLQSATAHSFINNSDAEGFYCDGLLLRSMDKINLLNFSKDIKKSNIIITHQRISTSGFAFDYTQPFESGDFVLVHNGVINDFLGKEGSDTYGFFNQFNAKFKDKCETSCDVSQTRESNIISVIKGLLDSLTTGFYSIALLDKKTDRLYYFKNDGAHIHFYQSKNFLFITTCEDNGQFLNMLSGEKFYKLKCKSHKIYRIEVIKENIKIQNIGKIKRSPPIKTVCSYPMYNDTLTYYEKSRWGNYKHDSRSNEINNKNGFASLETELIVNQLTRMKESCLITEIKGKCTLCNSDTKNLSVTGERVCDDCIEEYTGGI